MDQSTLSVGVGASKTLTATITPSNADNTNVNWTTSDSTVATVSGGTVTGVAEGTATITATSAADSTKKATCTVTVTAVTEFTIDLTDQGFTNQQAVTTVSQSPFTLTFAKAGGSTAPTYYDSGSSVRTYANNTLNVATSGADKISKIVFTLGGTTSATPSVDTGTFNGNSATWTGSATSITFTNASTGQYHYKTVTITVTPSTPVYATNVSLPSTQEISLGRPSTIQATYTPSNANQGLGLIWSSSNTSVATIDSSSGEITPKTTGTTTITAKLSSDQTKQSSCKVTVIEQELDEWTILLYLCGADLESGGDYGLSYGGAATSDIQEILSVSGQPDDVNFVIQTGGAAKWKSTYNISKDYNQRYHVENKSLVKDNNKVYDTYQGMGESSTLQDFLEWGLETYPAKKTGVILWNHGGGLYGVCYDEKDGDGYNSLTNDEVVSAVSGALTTTGLSKLEFIGYDACLMQTMEVAEFNYPYFNYQIGSQESEAGSGWDYDTWVDDLYAKNSTETILKAIVDGFITDNGGVNATGEYYDGTYYPADQTLSYLDLSQISTFKTAWESMASQVKSKINNSNKSSFKSNVVGASKYFAGDDYTYFATFDCYDFLDKLAANSTFNPGSTYINNVKTALSNLVKYNVTQKEAAEDAHGLCFYFGKAYNSSTYSHFSNWVSIVSTVGGYSQS